MAWQYQHYQPPGSAYYPPTSQEPYAAQGYHHAWYGYTFQQHPQARPSAPIQQVAPIPTPPAAPTPAPPPTTTATFSTYNPTFVREPASSTAAGTSTGTRGPRRQSQLKGLFAKELPKLMYSFGDDKQVANDSVAVMEEILIEYIVDVCQTSLSSTRKTRLQIEDLRRTLSRHGDSKKLARMEELLFMQEDIKRARKQFPDDELGGGDNF
ncbi:hypothetical protein M0805_001788 [Coniferiporia weirii]|nr:hypothetical protein M0805_001788 [Coniferiporia weirii]